MIIDTIEKLREHISVNSSIDLENITPYLKQASRKFLKPIIGKAQLDDFISGSSATIKKEAISLACEAEANFAFYLGLPILAVQITDSGIQIVDNEHTKTATDKQFKELQRSFKKSGHEALDELLSFMEENKASFDLWVNSPSYTVFKELLVKDTATFNKHFHIFNSRQTFIALKPNIKIVEDQFIKSPIGNQLLKALKEDQEEPIRKEVKTLLQQSIVAYTVMKTVDNGMFVLDASGIHMRFDALPYESTVTNINLKVNDLLIHTKKNKKIEGDQYLKLAVKTVKENISLFPEFIEKDSPKRSRLTQTKGIVGL